MFTINKKVQAALRHNAEELQEMLGTRLYHYKETVTISGEDLLLSGKTEINGVTIDPEKEDYQMTYPAQHDINYYRVLKRAYKRGGKGAVEAKILKLLEQFYDSEKEVHPGSEDKTPHS